MKTNLIIGLGAMAVALVLYVSWSATEGVPTTTDTDASTPVPSTAVSTDDFVTLTGTYTCLPLLDGSVSTTDCAFGIRTDDGKYYAVNFGAGAGSMADFRDGARITARGTIILAAALNPNSWSKFQSEGLFTILEKQ
jgi:hypothetical protein